MNWKSFAWIDADVEADLLLDLGSNILIIEVDEEKYTVTVSMFPNSFTSNGISTILRAWFLFTTLTHSRPHAI